MDSENSPQKTKKPLHLLPHEIIEEILAILPVKSVLRFRCVSKSWRSSIDSRFFKNKRLRNSTQRVICYHTKLGLTQRPVRSYVKEPDLDPSPIDDPNNNHLMTGSTVVGSCNGLLCILKEKSFFLWNPAIRVSTELPKIDLQMTKYGFGWDEETDEYKVFALVSRQNRRNQYIGKLYSSRTNSWKTVQHGCLSLHKAVGAFACGKIHWLTQSGREIESLDLKSEVFGMMEHPCEPGAGMWVEERYGCLSVGCTYNQTRLDVWIMEKYGVKESWVKRNTAPIPGYNCMALYNRHDKGITFLPRKRTDNYAVNFYVESLVSPVWNSRQGESEQEQIHAIRIAEGRPKREIKRRPARQKKGRAAGSGVEVTRESEEIVLEQPQTSVVECRPKRQNKRKEMEKEKVHTSVAEGRPKRQNRRRPARYDT